MKQPTIRILSALGFLTGAGIAVAGCGGSDCESVTRYAANVEVVGATEYTVQWRAGSGEFQDCQMTTPDVGTVPTGPAKCGAQAVGTFEIRATASDGRTASTSVTPQGRSDGCGPIERDVVLDLSN